MSECSMSQRATRPRAQRDARRFSEAIYVRCSRRAEVAAFHAFRTQRIREPMSVPKPYSLSRSSSGIDPSGLLRAADRDKCRPTIPARRPDSRWVDTVVPLHLVQRLLGHANISQKST